jgi:putative membrane protein
MTLVMVGFWALVIFGVVSLFRLPVQRGPRRTDHADDAQRILDERFARGEIDAEEYRSRRSLLPPTR